MSLRHPGSKYYKAMPYLLWQRVRRLVLVRDSWKCTRCGRYGRLEVHHIKELQFGGTNDMSNLQTLCRDCHLEHHQKKTNPERLQWRQLTEQILDSAFHL